MLGHLGINVANLAEAKAYYDSVMPLLGYEPFLAAADEFAFRPALGKRGTYLFFSPAIDAGEYSRDRVGLQHLAFIVRSRSAVDGVHRHVLGLGGHVLHQPQTFPQYPQPYDATFWLDPFGCMLEAVCHHDCA